MLQLSGLKAGQKRKTLGQTRLVFFPNELRVQSPPWSRSMPDADGRAIPDYHFMGVEGRWIGKVGGESTGRSYQVGQSH